MKNDVLKVGLLWHSITSDNLGVGALTLAQIALISKAAVTRGLKAQFVVIGTTGGTPYPIEDGVVIDTAELSLTAFRSGNFKALRLLKNCDIVFDIGEGDSFADIYGVKRLTIQVAAKLWCKLFGKRLVLSPQTIGPFKSKFGRILGKLGIWSSAKVFARDSISMNYLKTLGASEKAEEVIDVAFALPFKRPAFGDGLPAKIGINVSGLLYNGGYDGKNMFGLTVNYAQLIDRLVAHFASMPNCEVHLVPHVISNGIPVEDDYRVSEKIAALDSRIKIAKRFASPSEAKSYISGMDFFFGARMHACIGAFASGVPVVPMAYSRKFNGLFNSLGYVHVADCLKFNDEAIFEQIVNAFANRDVLSREVEAGNALAAKKLDSYVKEVAGFLPA